MSSFINVRKEIRIANDIFVIRTYEKRDYPQLNQLLDDYYAELNGYRLSYNEKGLNNDIKKGKLLVLVTEMSNKLIGFVTALELNDKDIILLDGYIIKDYRSVGLAQYALYLFFKSISKKNYERVLSFPNDKSKSALVKIGFEELPKNERNIKEQPFYTYALKKDKIITLQRK